MSTRSAERTRFLEDIITTAIEGGIGYWSQTSQYQWRDEDDGIHVVVGQREGDATRATIHPLDDEDFGDEAEAAITADTIAAGIALIRGGEFQVNWQIRGWILTGDTNADASEIDSDAADVIVQAALFGKLVYG